ILVANCVVALPLVPCPRIQSGSMGQTHILEDGTAGVGERKRERVDFLAAPSGRMRIHCNYPVPFSPDTRDKRMAAKTDFDRTEYASTFQRDGYFIHNGVVSDEVVNRLRLAVAAIPDREEVRRRRSVYGVRNLLEICPAVRELAAESTI